MQFHQLDAFAAWLLFLRVWVAGWDSGFSLGVRGSDSWSAELFEVSGFGTTSIWLSVQGLRP